MRIMFTAKTPGFFQPKSSYHSYRHTALLEGNITIGKEFSASIASVALTGFQKALTNCLWYFLIATAAAESWKEDAYLRYLM